MRWRRRLVASAALVVIGGLVAGFGFAPLVRWRMQSIAAARRVSATVGTVTPGWFGLNLRDVRLTPAGVPVEVGLRDVRVDLSPMLSPSRVEARQVDVQILGDAEAVEAAIRAWEEGRRTDSRDSPTGLLPVTVGGVSVVWRAQPGDAPIAEVAGGSLERSSFGWRGAFESAHLRQGALSLGASGVSASASRTGAIREMHASRLSVAWTGEAGALAATPPLAAADPTPPPLPLVGASLPATDPDASMAARFHMPELRTLRARLAVLTSLIERQLTEDANVNIDALEFEIGEGARLLSIGRGPLSATRKPAELDVTFSTQPNTSGTPVSFSATIPLDAHDAALSFAGGPISLALLGFEEGAAGLVDVDQTTVNGRGQAAMPAAGDAMTFDGQLAVHALAINRPSVANEVVRGVDATLIARGVLDDHGALRLDDGEISVGALHLIAHGAVQQDADHFAASLSFELATTRCQALLLSMPTALIPILEGAEFTGTLGAKGTLVFDSRKLDDLLLDWKVDDGCTLSVVPEALARERFLVPFEHTVYLPDGTTSEETTGPTSDDWAELDHISPFVQVAVLTTEDGAFYRHHGFNRAAIRNALVANLKAGRFARGASTITMQLAKNLFLFRDKTLSRKLEEIVLADYAEQTFSKKELMELYLNVIEFGPDIYGISKAALHYFGRKPDELNLAESLFLSSLLPSPLRFSKLAEKPRLSEAWTKHLRQLMAIAAKNDLISPEELAAGLEEEVTFHDPKDPLPPPRVAVVGTHFQPPAEEGEWQPTRAP
jgi:hypothetical protein